MAAARNAARRRASPATCRLPAMGYGGRMPNMRLIINEKHHDSKAGVGVATAAATAGVAHAGVTTHGVAKNSLSWRRRTA